MRKLQYICMLCFFLENLQNSMSEVHMDEKQEIKLQWPNEKRTPFCHDLAEAGYAPADTCHGIKEECV